MAKHIVIIIKMIKWIKMIMGVVLKILLTVHFIIVGKGIKVMILAKHLINSENLTTRKIG